MRQQRFHVFAPGCPGRVGRSAAAKLQWRGSQPYLPQQSAGAGEERTGDVEGKFTTLQDPGKGEEACPTEPFPSKSRAWCHATRKAGVRRSDYLSRPTFQGQPRLANRRLPDRKRGTKQNLTYGLYLASYEPLRIYGNADATSTTQVSGVLPTYDRIYILSVGSRQHAWHSYERVAYFISESCHSSFARNVANNEVLNPR